MGSRAVGSPSWVTPRPLGPSRGVPRLGERSRGLLRQSASVRSSRAAAPEPDDRGHVLDPGPTGALLGAATTKGGGARPAARERGGALRPPSLCAVTEHSRADRREVDRRWPARGARVDVDQGAVLPGAGHDVGDGPLEVPTSWLASCTRPAPSRAERGEHLVAGEAGRPGRPPRRSGRRRRACTTRAPPECSTAVVTTWRGRDPLCRSVPRVNRTPHRGVHRLGSGGGEDDLAGRAPSSVATASRASSSATRVTRPSLWTRPGSAGFPARKGSIASSAAGAAVRTTRGRGMPGSRAVAQTPGDAVVAARRDGSTRSGGVVSPYKAASMPRIHPRSSAQTTWGYCWAAFAERAALPRRSRSRRREPRPERRIRGR